MKPKVDIYFPNYSVDEGGKVRRVSDNYRMGQRIRSGYYITMLTRDSKQITVTIHRLVARNFIPNPDNLPYIDHIDGNKLNNHVSNLRWVTQQENTQYYYKQNIKKNPINQYDMNKKLIKKWDSLCDILEEYTTYKRDSIRNNLNGNRKSAYGYIWVYKTPRVIKPPKVAEVGEIFNPIKKFKDSNLLHYSISHNGRIQNDKGLIMSSNVNNRGYDALTLINKKTGKEKKYCIHRLVAFTYIKNDDPEKNVVNHIDGNKLNNHYSNLEWCTTRENAIHGSGIKVQMIDIETNQVIKIFPCISVICTYLNRSTDANNKISDICNDKTKNNIAFGYKWKRVK